MQLEGFVHALKHLDGDDIRAVACAIDELREESRTRLAARAAHNAVQAVRAAADASDIDIPDAVVIRVAREAALLARALVAGNAADPAVAHLAQIWGSVSTAA